MKRYFFSLLIAFSLLAACTEPKSEITQQTLEPADFQQSLQNNQGILLDVRTPEEYTAGHLSQALNIDYKSDNFESQLQQLDKTKPYFLYCKAGVRSEKAADVMKEMGFTQVYHLDGGIEAWKEKGLPVSKQE